jgi:hypothetical protein
VAMTERSTQLGREGKYDQIALALCKDLKAGAIILVVVDGRHGNGMSVSAGPQHLGLAMGTGLAELLRKMAEQLETGAVTGPAGARFTSRGEESS